MLRSLGEKFTEFVGAIKRHNRSLPSDDAALLETLSVANPHLEPTAYAYLLLDLAEADQKVDPKEISVIAQVLRSRFELSSEEAREAILNAHSVLQAFRGGESFVDCITRNYSVAERSEVLRMIEKSLETEEMRADYDALLRDQFAKLLD